MNVSLHYQIYALENVRAASFFPQNNYTVDKLTTDSNENKKWNLNNKKNYSLLFRYNNKIYKHIQKIAIVLNKIANH